MKIIIASDHRGVLKKEKIKQYLVKKGHEVLDFGPNTEESVDYPEYAFKTSKAIQNHIGDFGILFCGTGIGMSMAANKVKGIRCAKIDNVKEARLAKEHNDANVLAISSNKSNYLVKKMLEAYINAKHNQDEKYKRRNNMLDNYIEE